VPDEQDADTEDDSDAEPMPEKFGASMVQVVMCDA